MTALKKLLLTVLALIFLASCKTGPAAIKSNAFIPANQVALIKSAEKISINKTPQAAEIILRQPEITSGNILPCANPYYHKKRAKNLIEKISSVSNFEVHKTSKNRVPAISVLQDEPYPKTWQFIALAVVILLFFFIPMIAFLIFLHTFLVGFLLSVAYWFGQAFFTKGVSADFVNEKKTGVLNIILGVLILLALPVVPLLFFHSLVVFIIILASVILTMVFLLLMMKYLRDHFLKTGKYY